MTSGVIQKRNMRDKLLKQETKRNSSLEESVAEAERLFMSSNGRNGMQWTINLNSAEGFNHANSTLNSNESFETHRTSTIIDQQKIGSILGLQPQTTRKI